MSVKGSSALARLAVNPDCEILGAMVMQEGSEKRFYERVIGEPYDREFGERQSSRRRGAQFEYNAYAGDGLLLRKAFAPFLSAAVDDVTVRNLFDDYPGTKEDARIARLRITRSILADASAGRSTPDIIIQPQLLLPTKPGPRPYFFIAPDLLVRSRQHGVYLPGDLKSFVVRENEVGKGDLARVRLQLGAQLLALRHEYDRITSGIVVPAHGILVFSKPNGLIPHAPRIEHIGGAMEAIRIGIAAFLRHRQKVNQLSAGAEPYTVVGDLQPNFEDSCLAACVMAQWCRQRIVNSAADMGDIARNVLGDINIDRVVGLLIGSAEPIDDHERVLSEHLRALANQHGFGRAA